MRELCRNETLAWALDALEWSPERLARTINRELTPLGGSRRISRNSPAQWRDQGRVPHGCVPGVVAHVLGQALGRPMSVDELWQGRARDPGLVVPADFGLDVEWTPEGTVELLNVVRSDRMLRRRFLTIGGASLFGPAVDWAVADPGPLGAAQRGDHVTPELMRIVESNVAALRHLEDAGRGHVLEVTEGQFQLVVNLLRTASFDGRMARRLHQAVAEISQLAGWVCADQGDEAHAQRWYLTGLHASHSANDRPLGAHLLNSMARLSMRMGRPKEAVGLLEAAARAVDAKAMPTVRAVLAGFAARAHARAGDEAATGEALTEAQRHLDHAGDSEELPGWAYWMADSPERNFALAAGESFASLGAAHASRAGRHLERGVSLLGESYPRDRAVYLPTLAEAQRQARDLEAACATATEALRLSVRTGTRRGLAAVSAFRDSVRADVGTPVVDDFLAEARQHLAYEAA